MLCAVGLGAPALAYVAVPAGFRDVVARAEIIVRGHVTDVRSVAVPDGGIDSVATVSVDATLKGQADAFVSVRVPGGELGATAFVMVGAPRLAANQSAVFFLRRSADRTWRPVGLTTGIVRIRLDRATGRPIVQSPVEASRAAGAPRASALRPLLSVQEFDSMVRLVVAGQRGAIARPAR